ncbi:unnamed protein product, partial [Staurois parvus]
MIPYCPGAPSVVSPPLVHPCYQSILSQSATGLKMKNLII